MTKFVDDGSGFAVEAISVTGGVGVLGQQQGASGIWSPVGVGVVGDAIDGTGVFGSSAHGNGVCGVNGAFSGLTPPTTGAGVVGEGVHGNGVLGRSAARIGVEGVSREGVGVWGSSEQGEAVHGESHALSVAAVAAFNLNPDGTGAALYAETKGKGPAGLFVGNVIVTGDLQLAGADLAEEFDSTETRVEPGTVMVLRGEGLVGPCTRPYDRCVAGVVSGGGEFRPAIRLNRVPADPKRQPLALVGRVYCKVDATFGPIELGDLLTTSPSPGHAMKAVDPGRAYGAVLGKAMASMRSGTGLLPVLVNLQ
ncbi:hypothetical protein [Dactylosporangium sp. NPDC048998]|uniref:hypothetical protein n=1 Tax=Dactylosporangium sp. NPDC048998 TaxID=3363976 RepID=UPI00371AD623